jgi:uncharacterized membrane protein
MQSLLTLLTQLFSKAWIVLVITVISGTATAVLYISSIETGSTAKGGSQPVIVQTGPGTVTTGHSNPPPVVPEANAGLVLIPVMVAILVLSSRQFLPAKAGAALIDQGAAVNSGR